MLPTPAPLSLMDTLQTQVSWSFVCKGLPTLRLVAWASWRGPHGVETRHMARLSKHTTPDGVETRHMANISI